MGRNQWHLGFDYRPKPNIKHFGYSFSYQTPILFSRDVKTRLNFDIANGLWEFKTKIFLKTKFTPSVLSPRFNEFHAGFEFRRISTLEYVDQRDFEIGDVLLAKLSHKYRFKQRLFRGETDLQIHSGKKILTADYNFEKITLTLRSNIILTRNSRMNARLFAGLIHGAAPAQDQFFLSGANRLSGLSSIPFGQTGALSPQGQVHIEGDGNMTGYYGRHIRRPRMAAINLESLIPRSPFSAIFDAGYIDGGAISEEDGSFFDAGIKVKLGPLAGYLPIWISRPEANEPAVDLRWLIELGLSF